MKQKLCLKNQTTCTVLHKGYIYFQEKKPTYKNNIDGKHPPTFYCRLCVYAIEYNN